MHKNNVPGVALSPYSFMEETLFTNKDSAVWSVITPIPGKCLITALYAFNTGSGCGSRKAALSEGSASYLATVEVNSCVSKTTGLSRLPKSSQITRQFIVWSTTLPTSIRTVV